MQQTQARLSAGVDLAEYRRLLAREPDSLRFAEYADLLRRAGQLAAARLACERGLARHPGYPTAHIVMGDILNDLGKLQEAEAQWRRALALDPGHPLAHIRLGDLHLSRGDTDRATAAFEAALIYSPAQAEARAKLTEIRGAEPPPREPSAGTPDAGERQPGECPGWLSSDRVHDFIAQLAASPSIEGAAVVDADGICLRDSGQPMDLARLGPTAVRSAGDARFLLSRLGAGRLRSALARSDAACLRIVPLGEWTLIVTIVRGSSIGEVDAKIEAALAHEAADSADEGDYQ